MLQKIRLLLYSIKIFLFFPNRHKPNTNIFPFYREVFASFGYKKIRPSNRNPQIILSLTSIPARFHKLHLVIESILCQSLQPDRIILWLSKKHQNKNFSDIKALPQKIQKLQKRGLEIYFTKDIGPYRKLIPTLKKFPNDIIITIDDDVFYEKSVVDSLYKAYLQNGNNFVYCRRSRIIEKNKVSGYIADRLNFSSKNNHYKLLTTGCGGVLYPPSIFSQEVFNKEVFLKLAPFEDDSWYNVMLAKNKKSVWQLEVKKEVAHLSNIYNTYNLSAINTKNNREKFNQQFNALIQHYQTKFYK